jgi:bile acid:Na+ symporter, BASS family
MTSIGSSIPIRHLGGIFKKPKKIILGLILQIILLPLFAFLIVSISGLSPIYKIGIIILAACPGGTLSNFISYIIKGDTPLSVGLTSTNSLVILLTIPLYVALGFLAFDGSIMNLSLPIGNLIFQVFLLVIIPVLLGSTLRYFFLKPTLKMQKPLKIISSAFLAIFFVMKFFAAESVTGVGINFNLILTIIPWLLILNIGGFFIGYLISKLFKLNQKSSTTMGIEIGLQNTILALLITDVLLLKPEMGIPALLYGLFTFWTTLLLGFIFIRKKK